MCAKSRKGAGTPKGRDTEGYEWGEGEEGKGRESCGELERRDKRGVVTVPWG